MICCYCFCLDQIYDLSKDFSYCLDMYFFKKRFFLLSIFEIYGSALYVVIVGLLSHPQIRSFSAWKVIATPCNVLTIWSTGLHKIAIANMLISIVLCICYYFIIPNQWLISHLCMSYILGHWGCLVWSFGHGRDGYLTQPHFSLWPKMWSKMSSD